MSALRPLFALSSRLETWLSGLLCAVCLHGLALMLFLQYRAPLTSLNADIPVLEVVDAATSATPSPPNRQPKVTATHQSKPVPTPPVSQAVPTPKLATQPTPIPLASAVSNTPADAPNAQSAVNLNAAAANQAASQTLNHSALIQAPPAQPKVVTQGIAYLVKPDPQYPPLARRAGEEGTALIRVLVNTEGRPEEANVQQSSGFNRLDEAARKAVLAARFRPHQENGQAIRVWAMVPVNFTLEN